MSPRSGRHYLRPWLIGASIWGAVCYVILSAYLEIGDPAYLNELWFVLSLLWWQFGFAGIFQCLRRNERDKLFPLLMVAILPPLLLHFVMFSLLAGAQAFLPGR